MSTTYRIMSSPLSNQQYIELENWLRLHNLPICRGNKFHRDYSDGTLFAKLLSNYYPKLVELNNYPSRSSVLHKLSNWETINRKILRKLNLIQSGKVLKGIANAELGYIDRLLYQLMNYEKKREEEERERLAEHNPSETELIQNMEIMMINVSKKVGNGLVQVPQKMILYSLYENLRNESEDKDCIINRLNKRIEYLEQRLAIKDDHINDLVKTLNSQNNTQKFVMECAAPENKEKSRNVVTSSPCILMGI